MAASVGSSQAPRRTPTPAKMRGGRRDAAMLACGVVGLHVLGLGLLYGVGLSGIRSAAGATVGVGVAMTAYTLGMRHAFDVDHLVAIDNTTRKLVAEGRRPHGAGFFFALGHSTVVCLLTIALAVAVRGAGLSVPDRLPLIDATAPTVGAIISGSFLLMIGVLNLGILASALRALARTRRGEIDGPMDGHHAPRGLMHRLYGFASRVVRRPSHMYLVGLLFGLGFDTATEIALLATAGTAATGNLPVTSILCLPVLFAAGMTLFDTIDGTAMTFVYGWAVSEPTRHAAYNVAITAVSVVIALAIGTLEVSGIVVDGVRRVAVARDQFAWDVVRPGMAVCIVASASVMLLGLRRARGRREDGR